MKLATTVSVSCASALECAPKGWTAKWAVLVKISHLRCPSESCLRVAGTPPTCVLGVAAPTRHHQPLAVEVAIGSTRIWIANVVGSYGVLPSRTDSCS
jgi:hypothetical protein